ncbi:MAG TPA: helix-hairpin-helix domain-containing protein [Candidatus Angelobacter sp.]
MPIQKRELKERHLSERHLEDLISIGPAMLRDFDLLGIRSVKQLARQNPIRLYQKLCRVTGHHMDICCQDVFSAAIAQARNPLLPAEQCQWWYWSRQRKANPAHN